MNATINGQEYKFSGLIAHAYVKLYGMDVPTVIELDREQQISLIFVLASLIETTPLINNTGGINMQSVISRASDCHKLIALMEHVNDLKNGPLVFA
nr:hypothetical protein [Candidatus Sigynarchaeota archaeon]